MSDWKVELVNKNKDDVYFVRDAKNGRNRIVHRKFKFTTQSVNKLPLCTNAQLYCYDESLAGFGVRLGRTKRSYFVESDIKGGDKGVRKTLGNINIFKNPNEARGLAREYILKMRQGIDPREEVKAREWQRKKKLQERRKKAVTLEYAFFEFFQNKRHRQKPLKNSTKREYSNILNKLFEDWRGTSICDITPEDILKRHGKIIENAQKRYMKMLEKKKLDSSNIPDKVGRSYADSAMRTLSSVLSWAMWNLSPDKVTPLFERNPVDILNRNRAGLWYTPSPRKERIHDHQLSDWLTTLDKLRSKNGELTTIRTGCDYLEFVLFTGLRRNEAATLTWKQFIQEDKTLKIDDTKNRQTHILPLTDHLISILNERKRISGMLDSNKLFIFPSMVKDGKHLAEPRYIAEKVTELSGIKFRIHDLRRTFISIAGICTNTPIVKKLANHKDGNVTSGYQDYYIEECRKAMEKISEYIMNKKRQGQIKLADNNAS
ncbi:MAG: tyrosine-type recombinase/integrase [Candidatus Brocadiales bacterium]|nr:tyrosine-type recombinase/integrase [Candidatus Brocadiales bacterium]